MKIFCFLFVFILFRNEGVVAPRFSSSCTPKRITGGRTLVLCAQHLPRHQRIEMSQLVSLRHVCLPSHPTPCFCNPSRMEEGLHQMATVGNIGSSAATTKLLASPDKEGPTFSDEVKRLLGYIINPADEPEESLEERSPESAERRQDLQEQRRIVEEQMIHDCHSRSGPLTVPLLQTGARLESEEHPCTT